MYKLKKCALCGAETDLELSHIIPKMVMRTLKKPPLATSGTLKIRISLPKIAKSTICSVGNVRIYSAKKRRTLQTLSFTHI